jgi:hypothetical protein
MGTHQTCRYIISLYYAVVTMTTVGYGDIHATNVAERIAAILIMLVSFDERA